MPLAAIDSTLPPETQLRDEVLSEGLPDHLAWCAHSLRAADHARNQDSSLVLGVGGRSPAPALLRTTLAHAAQPRATFLSHEPLFRGARALVIAVADGLGGYGGGELASTVAIEHASRYLLDRLPGALPCSWDTAQTLRQAFILAQQAVLARARSERRSRIATTMTLACLSGQRMSIAHVGDSRCYRLHRGRLSSLTTDHNVADLVNQGRLSERILDTVDGRILWNVLGVNGSLTVQIVETDLVAGDRVLLCTDGLHDHLDGRALAGLLAAGEPRAAALRLAAAARTRGSEDDITALVVEV